MVRRWCLALAALAVGVATASSPAAARSVDLALVLAVDVSGSVNGERFELQRRGYAKAIVSPEVLQAIAAGQNHAILVTLVEWSGVGHQQQTVGWTLIDGPASAAAFGSAVAEAPRAFSDWTSISAALDYCTALLAAINVDAARKVIDISGDGVNNNGRDLAAARADALRTGLTINGLPILWDYPDLDAYYREKVIGGPGAFAAVAHDFTDFNDALLGKLVKEIAGADRPAAAPRYAARNPQPMP